MSTTVELHIVLDFAGVKCIRIVGPPDRHKEGHNIYLQIVDLVRAFDLEVKARLQKEKAEVLHGST